MKRIYWIVKAALHMRKRFGLWSPSNLRFCWKTADLCYDNAIEWDGEAGCPYDAIDEELSYWTD